MCSEVHVRTSVFLDYHRRIIAIEANQSKAHYKGGRIVSQSVSSKPFGRFYRL